jgi:hypothetical protein
MRSESRRVTRVTWDAFIFTNRRESDVTPGLSLVWLSKATT